MEYGLYNITSTGVSNLIPISANKGEVNSIRLANYSDANSVTVDLYLEDVAGSKSYLNHGVVIPISTTLLLDEAVAFDNSVLAMNINIAGTSPQLSIIIK